MLKLKKNKKKIIFLIIILLILIFVTWFLFYSYKINKKENNDYIYDNKNQYECWTAIMEREYRNSFSYIIDNIEKYIFNIDDVIYKKKSNILLKKMKINIIDWENKISWIKKNKKIVFDILLYWIIKNYKCLESDSNCKIDLENKILNISNNSYSIEKNTILWKEILSLINTNKLIKGENKYIFKDILRELIIKKTYE